MVIVGFDPGGESGIAIIDYSNSLRISIRVNTVDSVDNALNWINGQKYINIDALGVDTLLSWSQYKRGWRPMDLYLKHYYPAITNSIVAQNSLYGAMAVQGMAMAIELKKQHDKILLNETHPKVQYYDLTNQQYSYGGNSANMNSWLLGNIGVQNVIINNEHEWDALFSAWATYMGITKAWNHNLVLPYKNLIMPAGESYYYWP